MLDQGRPCVHCPRARDTATLLVATKPIFIDALCLRAGICPVEKNNPSRMTARFKKGFETLLGATRFRENKSLFRCAHFPHALEANFQCLKECRALCFRAD